MSKKNLKDNAIIVGEDAIFEPNPQINGNILVCGSSGSGKTKSISEPRLLYTDDTSLVITLSKRRLVLEYIQLFRNKGYHIIDLNFAKPECSAASYDPLQFVHSWSDVAALSKTIIFSDARNEKANVDPYWANTSCSLLSALISYKLMTTRGKCSMGDVIELFYELKITKSSTPIETSLDKQFERIHQKDPKCFCMNCWNAFRSAPEKTAGCILSTLSTTLDYIFTKELCDLMKKRENLCDFRKITKEKTVCFVTTSPVNPALHVFVSIFYSQMFKEFFEIGEEGADGHLQVPVHVLCDDFACGARIVNFAEYISVFREKGISVTMNVQSENQLFSIYGIQDGKTIINNSDTYVFMGGMDLETAESISRRLNGTTLEEILYMPIGQEFVFRRGQKPVRTCRYNIFEDKRYVAFQKEIQKQERQGYAGI